MLKQLGMEDCYIIKNTINKNIKLEQLPPKYVINKKLKNDFVSIIRAMNWLAGISRPDINFAIYRLNKHLV